MQYTLLNNDNDNNNDSDSDNNVISSSAPPAYVSPNTRNNNESDSEQEGDGEIVVLPTYEMIEEGDMFTDANCEDDLLNRSFSINYVDYISEEKKRKMKIWRSIMFFWSCLNVCGLIFLAVVPEWWVNSSGHRLGLFQWCKLNQQTGMEFCTHKFHRQSRAIEVLKSCYITSLQMEFVFLLFHFIAPIYLRRYTNAYMKSITGGLRFACFFLSITKALSYNIGLITLTLGPDPNRYLPNGEYGVCFYVAWLLGVSFTFSIIGSLYSVATTTCIIRVPLTV